MPRRRKTRARAEARDLPDPQEVLAGRVSVNPDVLFDLIHEVNPTGQRLPKTVRSQRYREKNQLQSLLIRRFGDDYLEVGRTGHENVVSLQYPTGVRDACHAVLSELEADARAWVVRQLDLADSPAVEDDGPANAADDDAVNDEDGGEDAATLLHRGRRAMESYEYEAAERLLKLAFAQAAGATRDDEALSVATALALLELLVDRLGLNPQALELEQRLTARAGAHPAVRTLLALAAARRGETRRALELLKGVSPARRGMSQQRVADVYATLAAEALRLSDQEAARRYLDLVVENDATHPQIPRLTEETEALLARHLESAEEELGRRYRDEGAGAVKEEARALADQGSRSELVRRILREATGQRREAEITEHLTIADQALTEGHLAAAARHYQAAADAGCERPDLGALVQDLLRRDRRRRDEAQLDAVLSRFTQNVGREALAGYLTLSSELRRRLREGLRDDSGKAEIDALEELGAPPSGARAHAAVAAVLALSRAKRKLERTPTQALAAEALAELAPHQTLLEKLGEARELTRDARSRLDALRRRHDADTLAQAEAAFQGEQIPHARKLLEELGRTDLTAEHQTRVEELRSRIRSVETVRQLEEEVERHLAADDLLGALERVHRLADLTDGDAKRRWLDQADGLCQRVKTAWRVEVTDQPVPLGSPQGVYPNPFSEPPLSIVDDEGRRLVLVNVWEAWLFLRLVDVASNEVIRRVSLRPPETFATPVAACWNGDRVSVTSPTGCYLEIRPEDGEILAWRSLRDLVPRGYEVTGGMLALPLCPYIWISTLKGPRKRTQGRFKDRSGQMFTADLDAGLLGRKLPTGWSWAIPILGAEEGLTCPGEPWAILSGMGMPPRLYSARGVPKAAEPILSQPVLFASISPDGKGLLLMASNADRAVRHLVDGGHDDDELATELGVVLVRAELKPEGGFHLTSGLEFGKALVGGANMVASSLALGLGFALVRDNELNCELVAVESEAGELRELYRRQVPNGSCLICDRCSRHVLLLVNDESGLAVHRLGDRPPSISLGAAAAPDDQKFPVLKGPFECWDFPHDRVDNSTLLNILRKAGTISKTKSLKLLRSYAADCKNPYDLVFLCRYMRQDDFPEAVREPFIRDLVKKFPTNAGFALLAAEPEAGEGNWQRVHEILRPIELQERDVTSCLVAHYFHLLGLARLYTGEHEEALATFEEGLGQKKYGMCDFESLIHLTTPMSDSPEPREWASDQPLVRQLLGAVKTADRALAAGDAAAAIDALERPVVWKEAEVQCAARLARAWLATEATTPSQRFYKRLALAFFLHVHEAEGSFRQEILLPGLSWDSPQLEDLAHRAREWL